MLEMLNKKHLDVPKHQEDTEVQYISYREAAYSQPFEVNELTNVWSKSDQ